MLQWKDEVDSFWTVELQMNVGTGFPRHRSTGSLKRYARQDPSSIGRGLYCVPRNIHGIARREWVATSLLHFIQYVRVIGKS